MSSPSPRLKVLSSRSVFVTARAGDEIYQRGAYLKVRPSWHVEESPFKVRQIRRMLKRHSLPLRTLCDVGCGAGAVLSELLEYLPGNCRCWGYDVSQDAIAMAMEKARQNLEFSVHDIRRDQCDLYFDLMLVLYVFEHVDDYLGLLQDIRKKAKHKLFHIPLDLSVQGVAPQNGLLRQTR